MVEKLTKALEGLKNIQSTASVNEASISKKEKMFFCVLAADVMVSLKSQDVQNLPIVIENMINLCDDKDSDVRMVADESLNRIIMSLSQSSMLKVQVELHNIIKKNGPARCLRAALTRFGQLSHYIRPNKGKGHVQMLIPAFIEIAKREEESIHETLASSLDNIFKVLGVFVQDNALKGLIKAFLHNLSSSNPVIRRCSASSIITIVQYCRKPIIFNCYVLNSLLDCIVPICEDNSTDLILGVLGCLRILLPALDYIKNDEGISGSFGVRRRQDESILSVDRLIQAYELCLHYTSSKDHNVVAAALETLNQILLKPPHMLESLFLSPAGFSRSYIQSTKENRLWSRSGSEMSVAVSTTDDAFLFDESDVVTHFTGFSAEEPFEVKESSTNLKNPDACSEDAKMVESPFKEKSFGKPFANQSTVDVDSDTESVATTDSNAPSNFLMRIETEDKEIGETELDCSRSNSQDELYSPSDNERLSLANSIDIGTFTDTAVPLVFCARHITISFLLQGAPKCLKSDRAVRVSIKSLALSCISSIVKLYPVIMKMNLAKNQSESCIQEISDILLYSDHSDPQIRGHVNILVGCYINAVLNETKNFVSPCLSDENSKLNSKILIKILLKGLQDKSSVCSRQALTAFSICVSRVMFSVYNTQFLPLLEYLPALACNSYWLVKVKLVEVLSSLPYLCICDLTKSKTYQDVVIDCVLLPLLGDEDNRVRLATAEALVRIIPVLHNGKSTISEYGKTFNEQINGFTKVKKKIPVSQSLCVPFSAASSEPDENVEYSLSIIVAKLTCSLLVPKNKHILFGYIEALKLLSQEYLTTVYSKGWSCAKPESEETGTGLKSSLITVVLSMLLTSPFGLDLAVFSSATLLLGNLFAGLSISYLKQSNEVPSPMAENSGKLWDVFKNERISLIAEEILIHLLKVLNFYGRLLDEVTLSSVVESSASGSFLPLLSPIKKQEKKSDEKTDDKKGKNLSFSKPSTHYAKLQQLLRNAYTNYKVSLDKKIGDKFLDLLESTLSTLSVLLEVATIKETGRCAEEILSYLYSVVSLRPSQTVICAIQLLKSLFGTNLSSTWEEKKFQDLDLRPVNLFDIFFHLPTEFLSGKIRRRINSAALEEENFSHFNRRVNRKVVVKNSDKHWLATCIRLFEPIVVKSMQLYTIKGDVELQLNVLRLLNQLVQLRVNYCMLDEKQIFLDFVLKQFELIEHGQIPGVEALLPHIFKNLILLSYEKQHSKPIMSIPKILQLCDGLMASDQSIQSHCIPALVPVVEDIFSSRTLVSSAEEKELETQREVLLSMLLRLVEYPEVMDMLSLILNACKTIEEKERWKRWSRQVVDTLLPLLSQDRLRIDTANGQDSFAKLMSSLSPNVLRPINSLLKVLFVEPGDYNCLTSLKRWLAKVTVLLETVLFVKEDALLNRLKETCPNINLTTLFPSGNLLLMDPFHVKSFFETYEPSETVARFILKVVATVATKVWDPRSSTVHLQQKFSTFFVCTYHILKSGTFHRITNSLQNVIEKEQDSLTRICSLFQRLIHVCPLLTCQYSYFLTLLNYCDEGYWTDIVRKPVTLSAKLVQSCGVISLCDYLCDNLSDTATLRFLLKNCTEELVAFSHEIPVKELFVTIQRKKSDWSFFLETISSTETFEFFSPHSVEKLLRLLEMTDGAHSGRLLKLVVDKFLGSSRLALSLLAGSIACRQVEHLLTLSKESVVEQLNEQDFWALIQVFRNKEYSKRHSALWSLLEKLGVEVFGSSASDSSASECIEVDELKDPCLGEDWYFAQVKQICCQKCVAGDEVPILLSKLNFQRILEIMFSPDFNLRILKGCLSFRRTNGQKHQMYEQGSENYDSSDSLYEASKLCLLSKVTDVLKLLHKSNNKTDCVLQKLTSSEDYQEQFWEVSCCLTLHLEIIYKNRLPVESQWVEGIAQFGFLCLKLIEWEIQQEKNVFHLKHEFHPRNLENGLKCCSSALKSREVSNLLSTQEKLPECVSALFYIISHLVPNCRLSKILKEKDPTMLVQSDQLEFLLNFIAAKTEEENPFLPKYLMNSVSDVVVNLCRVPAISSRVLAVPEGCDLQDLGLLKSFISRFTLIGWSSRQLFEEIWVALLSVLGFNTQGDVPLEETAFIVQASAAAVEGITALLKSTMLDSPSRKLIHHGRDSLSMKNIYTKVPVINPVYEMDDFCDRAYQFLDNLEITRRDDRYVYGLMSVEYLWTAVKQISSQINLYERHCEELSAVGLDLPSCIYLLTELYNQWIYQASPDIKIVTSSLKSAIVISDLFTDVTQFQWLLNFCLRVDEIAIPEDTIILPLVILGCCKAVAIILPNEDTCEKIKKLMLRYKCLPCRLSAVEGLLYLLQSYVVCYAVNHTAPPPPGSAFRTDEANFVANIVDTFLPVALELVQDFKLNNDQWTDEYDRCHWALIFYLLQHYQSSLGGLKEELLSFIIATLSSKSCPGSIMAVLVRGTQRLLLTTMIDETFREQLEKVALDIISNESLAIANNGLQLLSVLSFLDKRVKDIRQLVTGQDDAERVMRDMEKVNVLFEKLRKSYPKEAEVVGGVIGYVVEDFTASDVLTKVIQEFLYPHQPHQKILAGLLFKVFERAEKSLLEDWVVFSLPSFVQGLPVAMSVWTLNCFFVSASNQPWLRFMFPFVQARVRMAEVEDKKLLCLSAVRFYKQLQQESQRKSFAQTLEKARSIDIVFAVLLSGIS